MDRHPNDCRALDPNDERVDSPCVASCQLQAHGFCTGCYRHITEVVYWNKLNRSLKLAMLAAQPQRKIAIDQTLLNDVMTEQHRISISSEVWQATKVQFKLQQVPMEVELRLAELKLATDP